MFLFISALLSVSSLNYSPDPYMVFQKSDSVLSSINNVSYNFRFSGTGSLANIIPVLAGEAVLSTSTTADHPLMQLHFTELLRPGVISEFPVPSSYIATEDSIFRIDHTRMTVNAGTPTPSDIGIFDYPPASVMMEYAIQYPFADEITADSIAVLSPDTINGISCHVLHVFYSGLQSEAVWFIGMDDFLPYAVERIGYYGERGDPGGQLLILRDIKLNNTVAITAMSLDQYSQLGTVSLPEPGESAMEIFLADTRGITVRTQFPAEHPVLLCFFSSWDPASLLALGILNDLQEETENELDIYAISIWENNDPLFRLNTLELTFPVLIFGGAAAIDYRVSTVPSAVLISEEGVVLISTEEMNSSFVQEIRELI